MAFLDELREKATDVFQIAGKKANETYSVTKIKVLIADKQSALRILYRELGEIVYENAKKEESDMEAVEDKVAEIDLVLEGIEELKKQERMMKNQTLCPECGAAVDEKAKFCPECGSEM
ncbi:MAG: zinc ribbon domain-containing protein [Clostridia bacterium]|nr:zinc ribbon domain-containing protein [Clostridia bacterium]